MAVVAWESLGLLYTGGCSLGVVDTQFLYLMWVLRSSDKVPECDNADLNQPKKFRVGSERANFQTLKKKKNKSLTNLAQSWR